MTTKKKKDTPPAEPTPDPGTSALEQTYPEIVEAPPVVDDTWKTDDRPPLAEDQEYPQIAPAEPVRERVEPRPAAYVDPGKSKFAQGLVESLVNAGLMEPE